jgi:hypothetical protein
MIEGLSVNGNVYIPRINPDSKIELEFLIDFIKSCSGYMYHTIYEYDVFVKFSTSKQADYAYENYYKKWYETEKYKDDCIKTLIIGAMFITFGMFCK